MIDRIMFDSAAHDDYFRDKNDDGQYNIINSE